MKKMKNRHIAFLAVMIVLSIVACGGSTGGDATTTASMDADMDMDETFSFGAPADSAQADRTIEIKAEDSLTFDPNEITVDAGETITFNVVNSGNLAHDFTIGDEATQEAHETEMVEMAKNGEMMMHDEANAMSVPAGETKELTWHFTEAGTVLIGCHQPGHYAGGMKATIDVQS